MIPTSLGRAVISLKFSVLNFHYSHVLNCQETKNLIVCLTHSSIADHHALDGLHPDPTPPEPHLWNFEDLIKSVQDPPYLADHYE